METMKVTSKPRKSNGVLITILISLIVVVAAAAGGAWFVVSQQKMATDEKATLNAQIDTLTADKKKLQASLSEKSATPQTTPAPSAPVATAPSAVVGYDTYTNDQYGFSVQFPKAWLMNKLSSELASFGVKETDLAIPGSEFGGKISVTVANPVADADRVTDPTKMKVTSLSINGYKVKKYALSDGATPFSTGPEVAYDFSLKSGKVLAVTQINGYEDAAFQKIVNSVVIEK